MNVFGLFFFLTYLFLEKCIFVVLVKFSTKCTNNMCLCWRVERLPLNFPQNLTLYGAPCNVYVEVYSIYFNQSDYTN